MKLEDLYVACAACGGSGEYSGPARSADQQPFGPRAVEVFGKLCEECGGTGGTVTESGRAIIEFLRVLKGKPQLGVML